MSRFEGSFMGDTARLPRNAKLECGVCWWVYDPAKGDDVWQVSPGTKFADLPSYWRCPNCDAEKHQFMICGSAEADTEKPDTPPEVAEGKRKIERLTAEIEAAYRNVENRIKALPVHNARLDIALVSLRRCPEGLVGAIATPWCLNLLLLADNSDEVPKTEGSKRMVAFPSGRYEFITGQLDGVGRIESCSLFSPMDEFDNMDDVLAVAEESIRQLFEVPEAEAETSEPDQAEPARPSRRSLLGLEPAGKDSKPGGTGASVGGQ